MPLELERALRELEPDWPPTPDLAVVVRARIAAPAPRVRRPWVPALAVALGAFLVFAVVMAASPPARSTVLRWLGLKGVEVRHAPPTATPPPVRRGAELGLGTPVTLAAARRAAGFQIPVPSMLGPPAAIYLSRLPEPRVSLVYGPGQGIPRSRISGVGLLVTALRGDPFPLIQKTIGAGTRAERLTIAGSPALWLRQAHGFAYASPSGGGFEPQRLADRTLLVERGGVLLRIEGRITRARAIEIARDALS